MLQDEEEEEEEQEKERVSLTPLRCCARSSAPGSSLDG